MIIFESSPYDASSISSHLGKGAYSYAFVRKAFARILDKLGVRIPISDPASAESIISAARTGEDDCVHLAFFPPHDVATTQSCPTVPVFAWEFETIPTETWDEERRNDWRVTLRDAPFAITHSAFAAEATKRAMGDKFAVWSIPAPIYDEYSGSSAPTHSGATRTRLRTKAVIFDANALDLSIFSYTQRHEAGRLALNALQRRLEGEDIVSEITLEGVVFTTVLNPVDGRKNWSDLVAGFVWAFRDVEDATLIIKVVHHSLNLGILPVLSFIQRLKPFKCRIVVLYGMLSDEDYRSLIEVTTYAVNTSTAEGQCLPLMEFMSAGRPAVAPRHSALTEYVNQENSFVIESEPLPTHWPHDPRRMIRCHHHRPSFTDIQRAFVDSYNVRKNEPKTYQTKSSKSREALSNFCSDNAVHQRLSEALSLLSKRGRPRGEQDEATLTQRNTWVPPRGNA